MTKPGPAPGAGGDVRVALRAALKEALRGRDMVAASALRSALAAIGNAEAVPRDGAAGKAPAGGPHIAGASAGLGAAEVPRRELGTACLEAVVAAEITERESAAREYERAGHDGRAARLRREAQVLAAAVGTGH